MLNYCLKKLGLNQAILFIIGLRAWQTISGLITLFLIAHFFTAIQQGFYYTFSSIVSLQIFFEMGLSYVLIQFCSHEFVHLSWAKFGRIIGGEKTKRLKALLIKSFYWYRYAAIFFVIMTIPAGLYFFSLKANHIDFDWKLPWIFLVIMTGINLLLIPFLSCIEGSGEVKIVYRLRFFQSIIGTVLIWLIILCHGGLYAAVSTAAASAIITTIWLCYHHPILLKVVSKSKQFPLGNIFSWKNEVWPMQWRIAISWISGYFINQIFVPILFYYQNPIVAGQMGMSLAITTMIVFIGQAWINAKAPTMGSIAAKKDWQLFDSTFRMLFLQSVIMVILACIAFISAVLILQSFPISHRLLSSYELFFMIGSAVLTHCINCIAQYLRSHKQEPFMVLSVIGAILIACSAWFFGKYDSSEGIVIAVFLINLLYGLPSAIWLWKRKKKQWHQ